MMQNEGTEVKSMSKYTTGELAKLCEVSVRTVQFYDGKNLLKPAELPDGGRRLYSDDDLKKLRLICMLKSFGLSLDSIKGILDSETPGKVLLLLLDEQAKHLDSEISERQRQLKTIEVIREHIRSMDTIPANSVKDIEHMMNGKKMLRKTHATMLAVGIVMDIIQIGTLVLWIARGIWWPFAAAVPLVVLMGLLLIRMYYNDTMYICAECNARFRPALLKFLFSAHTPKTRKLKCPVCGHTGYCIETFSEN